MIKTLIRNFHVSRVSNLVSKEFEDAKANVAKLQEDHGNDVKLKMYALFKQVIVIKYLEINLY